MCNCVLAFVQLHEKTKMSHSTFYICLSILHCENVRNNKSKNINLLYNSNILNKVWDNNDVVIGNNIFLI